MKMENFWKIFIDNQTKILTYVPSEYKNGDGVYHIMKQLQKIYGWRLNGYQKYSEMIVNGKPLDSIDDFNIILRTGYNVWGTRLISAHLFHYNPDSERILVDNNKIYKVDVCSPEYVYKVQKKQILANNGWRGFREYIVKSMGDDCAWSHWGDAIFGEQKIITLDRLN